MDGYLDAASLERVASIRRRLNRFFHGVDTDAQLGDNGLPMVRCGHCHSMIDAPDPQAEAA